MSNVPRVPVPPEVDAFLAQPNPAVVATIRPDGTPHTAATWYDWEDGRVLLNMAESRPRLGIAVVGFVDDDAEKPRHGQSAGHAARHHTDDRLRAGAQRAQRDLVAQEIGDELLARNVDDAAAVIVDALLRRGFVRDVADLQAEQFVDRAHVLGVALHERPIISRLCSLEHPVEIKEGMVFALETYCPAKDGFSAARIEEEIVVTRDGPKVITLFPAEELPIANKY